VLFRSIKSQPIVQQTTTKTQQTIRQPQSKTGTVKSNPVFQAQPLPQVQPTPKIPPTFTSVQHSNNPVVQKPLQNDQKLNQAVNPITVQVQSSIIPVPQNIPRQEIVEPQQHLDSFHEQSEIQLQKLQSQKEKQDFADHTQVVTDSSLVDSFEPYPQDYYKKYLNFEPCLSSPCVFGKNCVNNPESVKGFECIAPQPMNVPASKPLSANLRQNALKYQSKDLLLAFRKRMKLEQMKF